MSTETIDDGTVYVSKDGRAVIVATDQVWLVDRFGIQKSGAIFWELADDLEEPMESRKMRAAADVKRAFDNAEKSKDDAFKRAGVFQLVQNGTETLRSLGYGQYLDKA